jgi:uncharacterized protein
MLYEMQVAGLTVDPITRSPILILKDTSKEIALPIWVGLNEANAIMLELEQIPTPRPMTHDLLRNMLSTMNARVQKVIVSDLKDDTYYAIIEVVHGGEVLRIDSRTSDAIALALRTKSPIFVDGQVIEKSRCLDVNRERAEGLAAGGHGDDQRLDEWLSEVTPDDFVSS